jgi:hypothetical protein
LLKQPNVATALATPSQTAATKHVSQAPKNAIAYQFNILHPSTIVKKLVLSRKPAEASAGIAIHPSILPDPTHQQELPQKCCIRNFFIKGADSPSASLLAW